VNACNEQTRQTHPDQGLVDSCYQCTMCWWCIVYYNSCQG